jgi:hypothetical protein
VVEDGAFTITSTVGLEPSSSYDVATKVKDGISSSKQPLKGPSPRFGAHLAVKQGMIFLFGGMVEDANDRQLTHKDLYCLGINNNCYLLRRENAQTTFGKNTPS